MYSTAAGLRQAMLAFWPGSRGVYASSLISLTLLPLLLAMPHRLAQLIMNGGSCSVTSVSAQSGYLQQQTKPKSPGRMCQYQNAQQLCSVCQLGGCERLLAHACTVVCHRSQPHSAVSHGHSS